MSIKEQVIIIFYQIKQVRNKINSYVKSDDYNNMNFTPFIDHMVSEMEDMKIP